MKKIATESFSIYNVFERYGNWQTLGTFLNDYDAIDFTKEYEKENDCKCLILQSDATGYEI